MVLLPLKWIQLQLPRISWDLEQLCWSLVEYQTPPQLKVEFGTILRNIGQLRSRGRLLSFRKADSSS